MAGETIVLVGSLQEKCPRIVPLMREYGYQVLTADTSLAAIEVIRDFRVGLLLSELRPPGMALGEFLPLARTCADDLSLVSLILVNDMDEVLDAIEAGADETFLLGSPEPILGHVVSRLLDHRRLKQAQQREADELHRALQEIGSLTARLQDRNAALKREQTMRADLSDMIVHDLRSPLMNITGVLEMLESGHLETGLDKTGKFITNGLGSCRRLLSLIDSLLEMSQAEAGLLRLRRTKIHLNDLLRRGINQLAAFAERKRIEITTVMEDVGEVFIDPDRIERVVVNLLFNALKHVPAGGRVEVGAVRADAEIQCWLENSGPTIHPDYHEHIFEKFQQAENRKAGGVRGSGIGLAYCKMVIDQHGGRIELESPAPGRPDGVRVTFSLPAGGD